MDDGTACEIGMFHALMQSDPSKKGIVGLLTDIRGMRGESTGLNLFVQGAIEDVGRIVASIEEARDVLRAWGWTSPRGLLEAISLRSRHSLVRSASRSAPCSA